MKKDKVILFGRGQVFSRKSNYIFKKFDVLCFIDNAVDVSEKNMKDDLYKIPIINPASIKDYSGYKVIILSYALGDMVKQLLSYNISPKNIKFGPLLPDYNTFEHMLFDGGEASLIIENSSVYYVNSRYGLKLKTNPSSLESIVKKLKGTDLYPSSRNIVEILDNNPLDDTYGMLRGKPVDRYYIEKFLRKNRKYIKGNVIEIGDREYTERYGGQKVDESIVIHALKEDADNKIIKGDLVTGKGFEKNYFDCFICTQTLQFIYDINASARNMIKSLKPGGVALITVAGISQIIDYERRNFGHYWSFTDMSLYNLFMNLPDVERVNVETYGNVKTATAFLYGISSDEMGKKDLDFNDYRYQVIITALVKKVD